MSLSRRRENTSKAALLPPEILLIVFYNLPREYMNNDWPRMSIENTYFSTIPLVCTQWRGPATAALYTTVRTYTFYQTQKLYHALTQSDSQRASKRDLKSLVKTLILPTRFTADCAPFVSALFLRVIALLRNLDELYCDFVWNTNFAKLRLPLDRIGPGYTLPVDISRFHGLTFLSLFGNINYPKELPSQITALRHLRCLYLVGFTLPQPFDPLSPYTPPLPYLEEITIGMSNMFGLLDCYLLACPNLKTLGTFSITERQDPPTELLRRGNITFLALIYCPLFDSLGPQWLLPCRTLTKVHITPEVFNNSPLDFPMKLDELRVWTYESRKLLMPEFISYIERGPKLGKLIVEVYHSPQYFETYRQPLVEACAKRGVPLELKDAYCNCSHHKPASESFLSFKIRRRWSAPDLLGKTIVQREEDEEMKSDLWVAEE
ncbi:hypothetical protein PIIN_05553 [Serendipita indica DSM 11827]|uniref:F-box domain-containing protein n=1 Tax=Serendipita indica (strain DSM 11827) TaxID=1109443 RepID=G4TJX3_SERID|nr:hypothetical protein PIIN_05553 [Serendipita indica DSM 11827]